MVGTLNDEIEKVTGDYINLCVWKYNAEGFQEDRFYFTSAKSYEYSNKCEEVIKKYELKIPYITKDILNGKFPSEFTNLVNVISNGMVTQTPMIIYRGLSVDLELKKNDIFDHKNPLFCSFHKHYATTYIQDVHNMHNINNKGNLLKINVPVGTKFVERNIKIDFMPHYPHSEIIFGPCKLQVISIIDKQVNLTIVKSNSFVYRLSSNQKIIHNHH